MKKVGILFMVLTILSTAGVGATLMIGAFMQETVSNDLFMKSIWMFVITLILWAIFEQDLTGAKAQNSKKYAYK